MKALLLSLGHGSSAVLIDKDQVICGYENERFTKLKSDSQYPLEALDHIDQCYNLFDVNRIYISHWFINGELPVMPNKYYNGIHLAKLCPDAAIVSVNFDFTHHDAHIYSAKFFAGAHWMYADDIMGIVADGFGTMGETMSIYDCSRDKPRLQHRTFGFSSSLGLLYQYATSYLGMKENQDEYKLLGYEPMVYEVLDAGQMQTLNEWATLETNRQLKDIAKYDTKHRYDPMCTLDALPALKLLYREHFDRLLNALEINTEQRPHEHVMAIIAYYVQKRLEDTLAAIVKARKPKKLLLSGGVFMNVKLNNVLAKLVKDICIMPLCGDQGAPLGLYERANPGMGWPGHLFWGHRFFDESRLARGSGSLFHFVDPHKDSTLSPTWFIQEHLNAGKIVNVVRGSMEFGARALCNTTTLALPTRENVAYINKVNNRATIMPMAPVLTYQTAEKIFESEFHHVHRSLEYMICTLTFKEGKGDQFIGAAHRIPNTNRHSGRPQVTEDEFMEEILAYIPGGVLINTSFNIHGQPIVFDTEDILISHDYQKSKDTENRIVTVVIGGEDVA